MVRGVTTTWVPPTNTAREFLEMPTGYKPQAHRTKLRSVEADPQTSVHQSVG